MSAQPFQPASQFGIWLVRECTLEVFHQLTARILVRNPGSQGATIWENREPVRVWEAR